jgi:hypothetical protein
VERLVQEQRVERIDIFVLAGGSDAGRGEDADADRGKDLATVLEGLDADTFETD